MPIKYKFNEANRNFQYPPIPQWDRDDTLLGDKDPEPPRVKIRRVDVTTSTEWGTGDAAASLALQVTKTNEQNEQLVRTYHSSLRDKQHVSISESRYGPPIWLVRDRATRVEAVGRAIHNYPVDHSEFWHSMTYPCLLTKGKLLRPTQLDNLREVFPSAAGVRVLVSGHLVVLFRCRSDMKDVYSCWTTWVLEVGGLYVSYEVVGVDLTTRTGSGVSISPNSRDWKGGLGLRLAMPDGTEAVTSVTHGSVYNPSTSLIPRTLRNWARSARNAILHLYNLPCSLPDSPVGKEVMSLDPKPIGTIIHTYDSPSKTHPYPTGYTHDLSLIASEKIPTINNPHIAGWASYTEALSGIPAYTMRLSANKNQPEIQPATIVGTQYLWDGETRSQSASLLWRTEDDSTPEVGWPGSMLYLGTDEGSKAVVFHNFRTRVLVDVDEKGRYECGFLRGGFLVPGEVRDARIV